MEAVYFPTAEDFRKWIAEAVHEAVHNAFSIRDQLSKRSSDILMSRKNVADMLEISLVTLNEWMKRGFPYHKQRGRVYFIYDEVMEHIKSIKQIKGKSVKRTEQLLSLHTMPKKNSK